MLGTLLPACGVPGQSGRYGRYAFIHMTGVTMPVPVTLTVLKPLLRPVP